MQPHVFVAMPFGSKEVRAAAAAPNGNPATPAVNVDFDVVYKRLIAPALKKAGCLPFRADEEPGAGDIRTDMFFELVTADAVVNVSKLLRSRPLSICRTPSEVPPGLCHSPVFGRRGLPRLPI